MKVLMKRGLLFVLFLVAFGLVACAPGSFLPPVPNTPTPSSPPPHPALDGTNWTLETYRRSDGNLVDVLPDTTITLAFSDGQIKGTAGCNNYFASYEISGNALTFGTAGATEMWCETPAGVMDQESVFLGLLASVASTQIQDDVLSMLDAAGTPLATWSTVIEKPGVGMANPASVHCEEEGGTLDIRSEAGGEVGYCLFPDGSECEEWAFFRNECAPHGSASLTPDMLQNTLYQSEWVKEGVVQLTDGEYRKAIMEGSATETVVRLADMAFGDLNNDGVEDAAVILVTDPGGSGTFFDLAAVLNRDGQPQHVATISLGDRAQVRSLSLAEGQISVEMVTHDPNDPMCCPTQLVRNTYALQGDTLMQTASEELRSVAENSEEAVPAELLDAVWQWRELAETEPASRSLTPRPENYTLTFRSDGSLEIQADCNRAAGSYVVAGEAFRLLLGPSTMAYCGDTSLDQQYLELLGSVDGFSLIDGRLQLHLQDDAATMTFETGW